MTGSQPSLFFILSLWEETWQQWFNSSSSEEKEVVSFLSFTCCPPFQLVFPRETFILRVMEKEFSRPFPLLRWKEAEIQVMSLEKSRDSRSQQPIYCWGEEFVLVVFVLLASWFPVAVVFPRCKGVSFHLPSVRLWFSLTERQQPRRDTNAKWHCESSKWTTFSFFSRWFDALLFLLFPVSCIFFSPLMVPIIILRLSSFLFSSFVFTWVLIPFPHFHLLLHCSVLSIRCSVMVVRTTTSSSHHSSCVSSVLLCLLLPFTPYFLPITFFVFLALLFSFALHPFHHVSPEAGEKKNNHQPHQQQLLLSFSYTNRLKSQSVSQSFVLFLRTELCSPFFGQRGEEKVRAPNCAGESSRDYYTTHQSSLRKVVRHSRISLSLVVEGEWSLLFFPFSVSISLMNPSSPCFPSLPPWSSPRDRNRYHHQHHELQDIHCVIIDNSENESTEPSIERLRDETTFLFLRLSAKELEHVDYISRRLWQRKITEKK